MEPEMFGHIAEVTFTLLVLICPRVQTMMSIKAQDRRTVHLMSGRVGAHFHRHMPSVRVSCTLTQTVRSHSLKFSLNFIKMRNVISSQSLEPVSEMAYVPPISTLPFAASLRLHQCFSNPPAVFIFGSRNPYPQISIDTEPCHYSKEVL